MLERFSNKKIMIVVAHPDDELLGQGATMHRINDEFETETHVVILGEGLTSRSEKRNTEEWKKELQIHRTNIRDAQKIIGYNSTSVHDFPDNRFDSVDLLDLIKVIEREKADFEPEIIFTHHGGDVNIDHQRTFEAVTTACRPMKKEKVKSIITFETPSGTEWISPTDPRQFIPNIFIKVHEEDVMAKSKAMECYTFEKREYPHPRSAEALKNRAKYWGNVIGSEYAEPFCLIRDVVD